MADGAQAGCRRQETFDCEKVCRLNDTTGKHDCTLRLAVILSNNTNSEASLQKVSEQAFTIIVCIDDVDTLHIIVNEN